MTAGHLLVLLLAGGLVALAWWRRAWLLDHLGVVVAIGAGLAGLIAMALGATRRPMPERKPPPSRPDAPLPEEAKERIAVEEHEALRDEIAKAQALPPKEKRDRLTEIAAKRWKK